MMVSMRNGKEAKREEPMNVLSRRVVKNRARIGMAWRAQEGCWVETYNPMTGSVGRRFDVSREQFFATKAQAQAWCNE